MGFLDNFKEAMKRGAEAADNYIEREKANQAASSTPAKPAAHSTTTHKSSLPEGVVMTTLDSEIFTFDDVSLTVSCSVLTKIINGEPKEASIQREDVRSIVREILTRDLPVSGATSGDLKILLKAGTSIGQTIIADLNSHGYEAAFKLPLMIRTKQ
ncbi:MAG: hypothetical protein J5778_06295 [Clostridiales bacterium]|nr:hypothetical protein [Clostridiales bacterium]